MLNPSAYTLASEYSLSIASGHSAQIQLEAVMLPKECKGNFDLKGYHATHLSRSLPCTALALLLLLSFLALMDASNCLSLSGDIASCSTARGRHARDTETISPVALTIEKDRGWWGVLIGHSLRSL
jgi:hypothetical protein